MLLVRCIRLNGNLIGLETVNVFDLGLNVTAVAASREGIDPLLVESSNGSTLWRDAAPRAW